LEKAKNSHVFVLGSWFRLLKLCNGGHGSGEIRFILLGRFKKLPMLMGCIKILDQSARGPRFHLEETSPPYIPRYLFLNCRVDFSVSGTRTGSDLLFHGRNHHAARSNFRRPYSRHSSRHPWSTTTRKLWTH